MPEPHVVTVAGPLPVSALGVVDAHDHLFIASPALRGGELDDPDRVIEEMGEARASGIRTIVELTPIGLGRRPDLLRRAAGETGLNVIGATGYHRDAHYPAGHWVHEASTDLLARRVVADLTDGMHPRDWLDDAPPDPARAGVIKVGASYQRIGPGERRRLEAAAIGSARTGAAIVVHAEIGTCGHEIVDVLEAAGASVARISLAHMDRNPDVELHAEIVARGVTLTYDTIGRIKYRPDSQLLELIEAMVGVGHGERIVLGLDLGVRDYYRSFGGGPGMRSLMDTFVPRLRRRIGDVATDAILVANPARFFAIPGSGSMTAPEQRFDVVVVGAGSAGSAAAISAARSGARTLLVDRLAFMGGTSTAVLDTFYAFYTPGAAPRRVVGGLGWEVAGRLTAAGDAFERPNTYGAGTGVTYDPEALKVLWERLAADAGVELLLHAWATGVRVRDGRVEAVRTWSKGGERWFAADVIVDASGDADVAALAGAGYDDATTTPTTQALSTLFKVANVDVARASAVPKAELWARMREAVASGDYHLPRLEGSWHRTPAEGVVMVHMTRIPNVDATDPVALTRAEVEGRRQVREYHRFLRDRVPGFEAAVVVATSPAIGIRESRRVVGDYRLTREDVLVGRRFGDEIALCGAPIEDHGDTGGTTWEYVAEGGVYGIPFGTLLPAGLDGLLVAGRCFSATHDAHASARSMATCMAMGQAAGTAAALAARNGIAPRAVAAADLRARLLADGALLDPVPAEPAPAGRPA